MTIPTLVNDYKKRTWVTGLQKFYSGFSQVLLAAQSDMNCSGNECMGYTGNVNDPDWVTDMNQFINKYFQSAKVCSGDDCKENFFYVDGRPAGEIFISTEYTFISSDGMFIKIMPRSSAEQWNSVTVDVNGHKGPNTIGRDIFLFRLHKSGRLCPYYGIFYASTQDGQFNRNLHWKTNESLCGLENRPFPSTGVSGYGCAARVMESGWKMNY